MRKYKIGDVVKLVSNTSGYGGMGLGKTVTISKISNGQYWCKEYPNIGYFLEGDIEPADRKEQAKALREEGEALIKQAEKLEKYETREDEIADAIAQCIKTKGDTKTIKKILVDFEILK